MKAISFGCREGLNQTRKGRGSKGGAKQWRDGNSRAVLVAPVEDQEGVGFAKEILFVQLVSTELHHH